MSFEKKEICLYGNRRMINRCRKAGLKMYNPKGPYNGYGYERLPLTVVIESDQEMETFRGIKAEVNAIPKKAPKTQEDIIAAWSRRLFRLLDGELTLEDCTEIAEEKLEAKEQQIDELNYRQDVHYSSKRQKLINRLERENPLRYIKNVYHAYNILAASERHNETNYDALLEYYHEEERLGNIPMGSAREYARRDMQPRYPNTTKQEVSVNG